MRTLIAAVFFALALAVSQNGYTYPIQLQDDTGKTIIIEKEPQRVVSLVPTVTETIFKLGIESALKGITYHTVHAAKDNDIKVVGGFFNPSVEAVKALNPDIIFVSSLHAKVKEAFNFKDTRLIELKAASLSNGLNHITLLGQIFNRQHQAALIRNQVDDQVDLIARKLAMIPSEEKLRVMRLMGREKLMTPGSDSFQNEIIRLAGGITHDFNRNGTVITVSKEEWMQFNPQVVYGCGGDNELESTLFSQPGWKDVDAVKNRRIYYFPCDLTCRAGVNTGYFVQWLAASIYGSKFAEETNLVAENTIKTLKKYGSDYDYVKDIRVNETSVLDFKNRSLVIEFTNPMFTLSTLEGPKAGVTAMVNHYTPPPNWLVDHDHGVDAIRHRICRALDLDRDSTSILITGADMNHLAMGRERFKDLEVTAFVTAGVSSNAMRMGRDIGHFYESSLKPGTINIILLANRQMSKRAMTRAIITATEAKTAALLDMDIRSSYSNSAYRATGTGTDNVAVVQGTGPVVENAGGHTKMGELIAKSVYKGVRQAIAKQNRITEKRNLFQRLKKRGINIRAIFDKESTVCKSRESKLASSIEHLLLNPEYAGFIEMALTLSDDYEKGLITDISSFEKLCHDTALDISNGKMKVKKQMVRHSSDLPYIIRTALNAVFNGVYYRDQTQERHKNENQSCN